MSTALPLASIPVGTRPPKSIPTKVPTVGDKLGAFVSFSVRKGLKTLAPQVGLEPTALRLTALETAKQKFAME